MCLLALGLDWVVADDVATAAFAITDEDGRRYLIYKEDGNSRKMPTPIWAQRLTEDGLKLTGERTELIRNTAPWEGAVVEAEIKRLYGAAVIGRVPSVVEHFYAISAERKLRHPAVVAISDSAKLVFAAVPPRAGAAKV